MYIAAMDAYGVQVTETAGPELLAEGDLEATLGDFYEAMLSIYYRDAEVAPGCLIFGTSPSSTDEPAIQARLSFGIEQTDLLMHSRISKAVPECNAPLLDAAVQMATNTLIAFSARAKSGATKAELT